MEHSWCGSWFQACNESAHSLKFVKSIGLKQSIVDDEQSPACCTADRHVMTMSLIQDGKLPVSMSYISDQSLQRTRAWIGN